MNAKTYNGLPYAQQLETVLDYAESLGLEVPTGAARAKFVSDCQSDRGRAAVRAKVSQSTWKTASTIPVTVRKDFPRLISSAALEELALAYLRAEEAAKSIMAGFQSE